MRSVRTRHTAVMLIVIAGPLLGCEVAGDGLPPPSDGPVSRSTPSEPASAGSGIPSAAPSASLAEQRTDGHGWRLLGHEQEVGAAYRTGVATTPEQYARLWQESGLPGPAPEPDWEREIVLWFGAVWGAFCPVTLVDVVTDGNLVHGDFRTSGTECGDDARPHSFVVAVQRTVLPTGPFTLQLTAQDPPEGAPQERTVIDADLSAPGATAADTQLQPGAPEG